MTKIFEKICIITELGTLTFLRGPKSLNHDPPKNVFFSSSNDQNSFLLCDNPFLCDLECLEITFLLPFGDSSHIYASIIEKGYEKIQN